MYHIEFISLWILLLFQHLYAVESYTLKRMEKVWMLDYHSPFGKYSLSATQMGD